MKHRTSFGKKDSRRNKPSRERRTGDAPEAHWERKTEHKVPSSSFLAALEAQRAAEARRAQNAGNSETSDSQVQEQAQMSLPGMIYDPIKNRHFAVNRGAINNACETLLKPIIERTIAKKNVIIDDTLRARLSLARMTLDIRTNAALRRNIDLELGSAMVSKLDVRCFSRVVPSSHAYTSPMAYAPNCRLLFCGGSDCLVKVFYIDESPNERTLHLCRVLTEFPNRVVDIKWHTTLPATKSGLDSCPRPFGRCSGTMASHASTLSPPLFSRFHTPVSGPGELLGHLAVVCMGEGELTGSVTLFACRRQQFRGGDAAVPNLDFSIVNTSSPTRASNQRAGPANDPSVMAASARRSIRSHPSGNGFGALTVEHAHSETTEDVFARLRVETVSQYQMPAESGTVWGMHWIDERTVFTLGMQGGCSYLLRREIGDALHKIASCRNESDVFSACLLNSASIREIHRGKIGKKLRSMGLHDTNTDCMENTPLHPGASDTVFERKRRQLDAPIEDSTRDPNRSSISLNFPFAREQSSNMCLLLGQRIGGVSLWDTRAAKAVSLFRSSTSIVHVSEYPYYDRSPYAYLVADSNVHCELKDIRMWNKPLWTLSGYSNDHNRLGIDIHPLTGLIATVGKDKFCRIWNSDGQLIKKQQIRNMDRATGSFTVLNPKQVRFVDYDTVPRMQLSNSTFAPHLQQDSLMPSSSELFRNQMTCIYASSPEPSFVISTSTGKWCPASSVEVLGASSSFDIPIIAVACGNQMSLLL